MKKIEGTIYWDGENLQIADLPIVTAEAKEKLPPGYYDLIIRDQWQWKTNAQMGQFFGAVAAIAHEWLEDCGYEFHSKLEAIKYLMENFPDDSIGLSDKWCEVGLKDGKVVRRSAMSISGMGRAELHDLANDITKFLADRGVLVPTPEEYKAMLKSNK